MNFCGTRINTQPAAEKKIKNAQKPLEVQKGMWKCEREAVKEHNEKIELQNKGALLSTLKTLDMSFLGKLDDNKNPVFGVFSTASFTCKLTITVNTKGQFSSINCGGLPKLIGDGYREGLKGKKLRKEADWYKRSILSANFVGLLPQTTKDKIIALRETGIPTFLVADTHWKTTEARVPDPDPLLIALHDKKVYLVDVFDASIEENYVVSEFTE